MVNLYPDIQFVPRLYPDCTQMHIHLGTVDKPCNLMKINYLIFLKKICTQILLYFTKKLLKK